MISVPKVRRLDHTIVLLLVLASLAIPARAATLTVNSIGDAADAALDGTCETGMPGECTLRAAIEEANNLAGLDQIEFNISGCAGSCTIDILTLLPDIVSPVVIDGSTQPGSAQVCTLPIGDRPTYGIVLNGTAVYGAKLRLESGSSGSTIRGLNIQNFTDAMAIVNSGDNVIECNFFGTDPDGNAGPGNFLDGVILGCDSTGNIIGGPGPENGNIVAASEWDGIRISGDLPCSPPIPNDNYILGNFVGVLSDGQTVSGNGAGIAIFGGPDAPDGTLIGLMPDGVGGFLYNPNVIGGNGSGIFIGTGVTDTVIAGNFIGTDPSGALDLGNTFSGVYSESGPILIGGTMPPAANLIAFNGYEAVGLVSPATGVTVRGNSIYSNGTMGIDLNLDGVTPNDVDDTDSGPNDLLNFPEISSASVEAGELTVEYSVPSTDLPLTIELFVADSDGNEGETFLGTATYSAPGTASVTIATAAAAIGDTIVATSTDAAGNTSEFSAGFVVVQGGAGAADTAEIPTLSTWVMMMLAALLAAGGVVRLRV